jgi:hypothetical protein
MGQGLELICQDVVVNFLLFTVFALKLILFLERLIESSVVNGLKPLLSAKMSIAYQVVD